VGSTATCVCDTDGDHERTQRMQGGAVADDYIKGLLSTGEVLLIDTKQHWVALLRYAIRPLLLIGLVVLLAILNQWLKFETLGFINDIVNWVLIVLIIVTIVWLPVDIVQWWSRRYVLTNRRAMRMQGLLRKSSFDTSIEQVNDIVLSQSLIGRKLGYADLTLLTANASNEAYEQLLDGPQFKKAVLDAKDAIRMGHPLQSLPEGFVVKGGTNDASIRAATKPAGTATDAAGAAGAAAVTTGTLTAVAPADSPAPPEAVADTPAPPDPVIIEEPVSASEPVVEPEPVIEPEPVVAEPVVEPEPVVAEQAVEPEPVVAEQAVEDAAAEARDALTGTNLDAPPADDAERVAESGEAVGDAASGSDDGASTIDEGASAS
jgi:hypothetical protein